MTYMLSPDRPTKPKTDWLAPSEAEAALGISRRTLMRWEKRGVVSPVRLPSGHRRFRREDIENLRAAS